MSIRSVCLSACQLLSDADALGSEKRKAEAERIRQKYPDRIPVIPHDIPGFPSTYASTGHLREAREI